MKTYKTIIILPIESIKRELDARLLVASELLDGNTLIYLCHHDLADELIKLMKGGVYVGKNIFKTEFLKYEFPDLTNYKLLKKNSFKFIHLDEEGVVFGGYNESDWYKGLSHRLNPEILDNDDVVCTWGKEQAKFYGEKNKALKSNIDTTGHVRFDLYRDEYHELYQEEVKRIKQEYGDFILVNLNTTNPFSLIGRRLIRKLIKKAKNTEEKQYVWKVLNNETCLFCLYMNLIVEVASNFSDKKIIIRLHPHEFSNEYKLYFEGVPNVYCVHEGTVTPWLMACQVLIHSGCTTGIEACLLKKPIVSFVPMKDANYRIFPSKFGVNCSTNQDVINTINAFDNGSFGFEDNMKNLTQFEYDCLHNLDSSSLELFINIIKNITPQCPSEKHIPGHLKLRFKEYLWSLTLKMKWLAANFMPQKKFNYKHSSHYFNAFDLKEIQDKLDFFCKRANKKNHVTKLSKRLLILE